MKRLAIIAAILISVCPLRAGGSGQAATAHSAQQKAKALDAPGGLLASSNWGLCAVRLGSGQKIASMHEAKRYVPASNMKLITTGAALLALGPDYHFKTRFAHSGEIVEGTLKGDLYIIGGGDPLIGELFPYLPGREFSAWKAALEKAGIKRIEGDIIGDGSYFKGETRHTDWSTEDDRTKDGVVPRGLTWRGKMEDEVPDGPFAAALHFAEWLAADTLAAAGTAGPAAAESGTAQKPGTAACTDSLGHALPDIIFTGNPLSGTAIDSLITEFAVVESSPLKDIARIANCWSDNFCAETLIKALGLKYRGDDNFGPATAALHDALAPLGLKERSVLMRFADGSGLSRKNYISPAFMVDFLKAMAGSKVWKPYLASIPTPGDPNSTLKSRLPKCPDKGRIHMKSGSMNGVQCFSGYILPGNGRKEDIIVFSLMVNNYVGSRAKLNAALDDIISALAASNR
jgi:D-alanyl-D-alanine carboxypeptidase/D-alanyl-D-alanine-endopeptidase (penicillin-binding protein 4)